MSRTLKRPMFRDGGRANSKGTGIMSGIEDREPHAESNPQGVGYSQSPFKKFVVDPAKTMISPFVNVGADIGNLGQMFFGAEPTFKYMNPFAEGSGLGTELQTASQFYQPKEGGVDMITGAQAAETDTETTEEDTKTTEEDTKKNNITDLAKEMETGTKRQFDDPVDDPDEIKLDDLDSFEEEIKRKAELYEKLLGGKDARTQAGFRALTAGGLEALEQGSVVSGLKKGFKELEDSDDLSRKAKLLAIQEKIEKDKAVELAKLKNKDVTTSQIRNYEYQIGLGKTPDEASKIAFGTGENIQARESEEDIRLMERKIIKTEGSGFEQDNITGYEQAAVESTVYGVPTVPYVAPKAGAKPEKAPNEAYFKAIGDVFYNPVTRKFEVLVEEEGTTKIKKVKTREEAFRLAGK